MNDLFQIIFLSIIQGITEFLPISSSAHLIFIPNLLGWQDQGIFLDVSMHFGSLLAIIYYYLKNKKLFKNTNSLEMHISFLKILIGTFPVLFFGYIFYDYISTNLRSIHIISVTTILFAVILLFAEYFKKNTKKLSNISHIDIFIIGIFQAIALVPGTSRSAIIIIASLLLGYTKRDSIVIALILSVPVIFSAMLFEVHQIDLHPINYKILFNSLLAILISYIVSLNVIKYFVLYINSIGFYPFMVYRIILGIILLMVFA
jgi:undecaprenyl-diphosphatase